LHEKIRVLEKFEEATVGRELKMIQLKRELERLKDRMKELETRSFSHEPLLAAWKAMPKLHPFSPALSPGQHN